MDEQAKQRECKCECGAIYYLDVPECGDPEVMAIWEQMTRSASCDQCADAARARREADDEAQRWKYRREQTAIPEGFWHYDRERGNAALIEWMRNSYHGSMYIAGSNGIGKTRAVCYAGLKLARQGKDVKFLYAPDFARMVARQWRDEGADPVAAAAKADVVILDDLGKEKTTARTAEAINALIDARYRQWSPIWITSNCRLSLIAGRMGEIGSSITSRLTKLCKPWEEESQ